MQTLLKWLGTFHDGVDLKIEDVTDGVAVGKALGKISPAHFGKIQLKMDQKNWVLKRTNVQAIQKAFDSYYKEVFGLAVEVSKEFDSTQVARDAEPENVTKMLQLALTAVYGSPNRSELVDGITKNFTQDEQGELMNLMQAIIGKYNLSDPDAVEAVQQEEAPPSPLKQPQRELKKFDSTASSAAQRSELLTLEIQKYKEQVLKLEEQNKETCEQHEKLKKEHNELEEKYRTLLDKSVSGQTTATFAPVVETTHHDDVEITLLQSQNKELTERIGRLADELKRTKAENETSRDDLHNKDVEITTLRNRVEQLAENANKATQMEKQVQSAIAVRREIEQAAKAQAEELARLKEEFSKVGKRKDDVENATLQIETLTKQRNSLQEQLDCANRHTLTLRQELDSLRDHTGVLSPHGDQGASLADALSVDEMGRLKDRIMDLEKQLIEATAQISEKKPSTNTEEVQELKRKLKEYEDAVEKHKDSRDRTKDEAALLSASIFDLGQRHLQLLSQRYVESEGNQYSHVALQSRRRQIEKSFLPLTKKN